MTEKNPFLLFLQKWKEIETQLKIINENDEAFSEDLISAARDKKYITFDDANRLNILRRIRNLYEHNSDAILNQLLQITFPESCHNFLDTIILKLNDPIKIEKHDIKDFTSCSKQDLVTHQLKIMRDKGFTHIPVLDDNKRVTGILSDDAIVRYLLENEIATLDNETIADISEFLEIKDGSKDRSEDFPFISRKSSLLNVKEIISSKVSSQRRVSLFLITENGKKDEALISIITVWDFFKGGIH